MSDPVIIDDGMSFDGYIQPVERLHGSVEFTYRIFLSEKRAELLTRIASKKPAEGERMAAIAVADRLLSWDASDGKGGNLGITEANVLRLHPKISNRLYRIVMGDEPPDEPPGAKNQNGSVDAESEFRAALNGESTDEAREKNLSVV